MNILATNRFYQFILLILFYNISYSATPNIGIVKLFYASNAKISYFSPQESITKDKLLNGLESQLVHKIDSSYSYNAFNAESILLSWQQINPNIVSILESESIYPQNESIGIESQIKTSSSSNYILIGWITNLTYQNSVNEFPDINKKSIIHNLDIRVIYKLFDINTKKSIFEFTAIGHGGNAVIVPINYNTNSYRNSQTVNNTITTFVDSVLHGLLLRHEQGYLNSDDN